MYNTVADMRLMVADMVSDDVADATITSIINLVVDPEINGRLNGGATFTTVPDIVKTIELKLGCGTVVCTIYPRLAADPPAHLRQYAKEARDLMTDILAGRITATGLEVPAPILGGTINDEFPEDAIFVGPDRDWEPRVEERED